MISERTVVDQPWRGSEPTIVKGYETPLVGSVNEEAQVGTVRALRELSPLLFPEVESDSDEEVEASSRAAANAVDAGTSAAPMSAAASAHAKLNFRRFIDPHSLPFPVP